MIKVSSELIRAHDELLKRLEEWARCIHGHYSDRMQCGKGCARCCVGLFDISVFDALRLTGGFQLLPRQVQASVTQRASAIQTLLVQEQPGLKPPYFLNSLSANRIDQLADIAGDVRCPLLDEGDSCLIYDYRPVTCRLEGIPMVDIRDGLFSDWCELNFRQGVSAEMERELALDYYAIQAIEQETAIFIPSVIHAFVHGEW